jgi:hypothetical protein
MWYTGVMRFYIGQFLNIGQLVKVPRVCGGLVLCAAGAVMNVVLALFWAYNMQSRMPLFLDTIWTIVLTFCGGPVYGIITGLLTNTFESIYSNDWNEYAFVLCNIFAAIVTAVFMRLFPDEFDFVLFIKERRYKSKNLINTIIVLFVLSLALCITMSVSGGLIAAAIKTLDASANENNGPNVFFMLPLIHSGLSMPSVEIFSRIPVNLVDRFVSVFLAFAISLLIKKFNHEPHE